MRKIKEKASSLPVFNGRVSDSSTSSGASSIVVAAKARKRATFNGIVQPTVFSISHSTSSVASLLKEEENSPENSSPIVGTRRSPLTAEHLKSLTEPSLAPQISGPQLSNYEKVKIVGQGSFGIAVLYRRLNDDHHVVFKQINLNDLSPSERDLAMNEVEVFSKLHHPNIISYLGSFIKDNTLLIEMEYADGGTLAQIIIQQRENFPERYIIGVFEQISSAINYMHSENILHRDLKTANVFLNQRGIVKIGDFGISKIMNTKIHAQTVLGTPYYFSPEMCEGKEYDNKSDIWALGCILGEMCCLKKTFAATNLSELVTKIMAGAYTSLPTGYSSGLRSLLSNLLQVDPTKRPTATEILTYWIPLIYRNLGKNKGYSYVDDAESTIHSTNSVESTTTISEQSNLNDISKASMEAELATAQAHTKEMMNAETVAPCETIYKRSVLYQVRAIGNSFCMSPIQLPPKACILRVAASDTHFVVVNDDGSVYTWGEGSRGQLGLSSLDAWKHYPSRMESVRNYQIISACAGEGFTILLAQSGTLLSCGDNSKYVLGHEEPKIYYSPKVIEKIHDIPIKEIEAGQEHVLALADDGNVYSWGTSQHGALGLGNLHVQQVPQKLLLAQINSKPERIFCGPNTSAILFSNGDLYICGSNEYNKLGFWKTKKVTAFKKVKIPYKVLDACFSSVHSVFRLEGGYILTMGRNAEGQRGVGNCNVLEQPTLVELIKDRFILICKCNDHGTIVSSDENVISFWGTRHGIPEIGEEISKSTQQQYSSPPDDLELGNNTAAFTNFLASVYKSELILKPLDLLALYASDEQMERGYNVTVNNIYPLLHSVLVLVDTTTPLISSLEELP